jgi:hypothetical protein
MTTPILSSILVSCLFFGSALALLTPIAPDSIRVASGCTHVVIAPAPVRLPTIVIHGQPEVQVIRLKAL